MNINTQIEQETILTMSDAVNFTHRSRNTLQKWITKGCRGVILEVTPNGGRWNTSKEAVERFTSAVLEKAKQGTRPKTITID